jgi:hypothetical protein
MARRPEGFLAFLYKLQFYDKFGIGLIPVEMSGSREYDS